MAINSTYFMHKRIHLETWHSPDGRTRNRIDHSLLDGRYFSDVIDVKALWSERLERSKSVPPRAKGCRTNAIEEHRRTVVEQMPSKDEREQQKTNIGKPDQKRGTYLEISERALIAIERHKRIQDSLK
jgi:hypothetical protein